MGDAFSDCSLVHQHANMDVGGAGQIVLLPYIPDEMF